jgi:ribose 5-phosphate isomerase B
MRIACGFDHAGVPLRDEALGVLTAAGHEVLDLGTDSLEPVDYPDVALAVARAVLSGSAERGVLVCGSGAGVAVAASKVPGIRAATCHDTYTAHQAVEHDDVNVLCLGARVVGPELAADILRAFAAASYSGEERHQRRLAKITAIERGAVEVPTEGAVAREGGTGAGPVGGA